MTDRTNIPLKHPIRSFSLSGPKKYTLANRVNVFYFTNAELDLLHFTIRIKAGSLFENQKFLATATFSQLIESVQGMNPSEIEDFLDYYGAVFQCGVGLEYITLNFVIPRSTCKEVLPFIYNFISHPDFKEENLILFKERKKKELQMNQMKVGYRSGQLMYHTLLNSRLSASEILTEEKIDAITCELMQDYHKRSFLSDNVEAFFTGNIDAPLLEDILTLFASVPEGQKVILPPLFMPDSEIKSEVFERREDAMQSSILLCKKSLGYHEEIRRDFSVLSIVLGGYFGSRLMGNLRESNGFTYGVYCSSIYFDDVSIFYIDSDVNVDKTSDAVLECKYEMQRLQSELITEGELDTVKTYMTGTLLRKLDGSVNAMKEYAMWRSSGLDEQEVSKMLQAIENMTPEKMMDMAKKYLQESDFTTIVVGNVPERNNNN